MKFKFRADSHDLLIFGVFSLFLLYIVAIVIVNLATFAAEGTLSGFANEIIENIPEGLEFVEDSSINKTYGWKLKDGKLVTNYLSDADINNLIKAANDSSEGNKVLDYKDVQVQFKVVANPVEYAVTPKGIFHAINLICLSLVILLSNCLTEPLARFLQFLYSLFALIFSKSD